MLQVKNPLEMTSLCQFFSEEVDLLLLTKGQKEKKYNLSGYYVFHNYEAVNSNKSIMPEIKYYNVDRKCIDVTVNPEMFNKIFNELKELYDFKKNYLQVLTIPLNQEKACELFCLPEFCLINMSENDSFEKIKKSNKNQYIVKDRELFVWHPSFEKPQKIELLEGKIWENFIKELQLDNDRDGNFTDFTVIASYTGSIYLPGSLPFKPSAYIQILIKSNNFDVILEKIEELRLEFVTQKNTIINSNNFTY